MFIKYLIVIIFIFLRGVFAGFDTALIYIDKYKISKLVKKDEIHMAIVIDDEGKVCGIVTMEDILEMLVGKIFDEYEKK